MRISRFYTSQPLSVDSEITLSAELSHYIVNVLRAKVGMPVVLFNGDGSDYPGEIIDAHKKHTTVLISSQISLNVESPLSIHLAQGVSKGDRMEVAIQKAVELGVSEITPIITENCNVKLSPERWQKKVEQWQKIAIGACEQSQRNVVPNVNEPVTFTQFLSIQTDKTKLILQPGAKHYLNSLPKPPQGFIITIGPEGGFTEQEIYSAQQVGFVGVNLGPRILRTETATITSLSILQSHFGDL